MQHFATWVVKILPYHYNDVIMGAIASQVTSITTVFSTVYLDTDQRKHQSSASLAFVGISPHKWPVTRKMFPFDDVIMWKTTLWQKPHNRHLWYYQICLPEYRSFSASRFRTFWCKVRESVISVIYTTGQTVPGKVHTLTNIDIL